MKRCIIFLLILISLFGFVTAVPAPSNGLNRNEIGGGIPEEDSSLITSEEFENHSVCDEGECIKINSGEGINQIDGRTELFGQKEYNDVLGGAYPASYVDLARYYSPVIIQDVGCTRFGDYITRIDYDGDYIGANNWDNLGERINEFPPIYEKERPLPANVYYALMETNTHYFIWYALFHPADDYYCHDFSHENDLEGIVLCVRKDGTAYGDLRMVQLQAHWHFYQYIPPGETGIINDEDDIDGTIELDTTYPGVHPRVYVQGGGHGLSNEDTGDWPSVYYYYTGIAEDPDDVGYSHVGYDLLSIASEMWEQRKNCCGSGHLADNMADYQRFNFNVTGFGTRFDGDDGDDDAASFLWDWDDKDDGDNWVSGDWFMHPAGYHANRFGWSEPFSTDYIFHSFGFEQLGSDMYNGNQGKTVLLNGPYTVVSDVMLLPSQQLMIPPGSALWFRSNTGITSAGLATIGGSGDTTWLVKDADRSSGIKILDGMLKIYPNGGIVMG